MNIKDFQIKKNKDEKITMLTCYDATFAKILEATDIDALLVGDSLSMVIHGHSDTTTATMDMMIAHTKAVRQKLKNKFLIADLPFLSYRKGMEQSLNNAGSLIQAGANAVKLEGADGNLDLIRHLKESGIPVMGHLGLTPQFIHSFGGWKVQGKEEEARQKILKDAIDLEKAGCFSIVLECVPSELAKTIQKELNIPCIGIGAGADVAGQVLVLYDLLGLQNELKPRFAKQYLNGFSIAQEAVQTYINEVKSKDFPSEKESYQ